MLSPGQFVGGGPNGVARAECLVKGCSLPHACLVPRALRGLPSSHSPAALGQGQGLQAGFMARPEPCARHLDERLFSPFSLSTGPCRPSRCQRAASRARREGPCEEGAAWKQPHLAPRAAPSILSAGSRNTQQRAPLTPQQPTFN